jgi:phage gpG-like protein
MSNWADIAKQFADSTNRVLASRTFRANVEEIVRTSIDLNFSEGGRFGSEKFGGGSQKWEASYRSKSQSGKPLSDTGNLLQQTLASVKVNYNGGVLEISLGAKLPQAAIHHFGGKIPITQKSRGFFFFKANSDTKNRKTWLALALYSQKNEYFNIKPRPYLVLQNDDVDEIVGLFATFVINELK